jgi:hypothetical protein
VSYDNRDRGALFKNDRKDGEKSPDYKGEIDVGGQVHWLNAWIRVAKSGQKYMALTVKPKLDQSAKTERTYATRRDDFHDDEIPF